MRFNKQELLTIASQTPQNFDREGILVLKEKQDGFFRRTEGSTTRWFRLRGNLLFYLRGTEQLSEPMGVIVLGCHQIKVQPQDENGHWPFHIVWDNGVCYRMATFLESERTLWLKAIQSAPYDNLKTQIEGLKQKLCKVQPTLDISTWRLQRGVVIDMNEIPLCELAVSCDNLLCDAHGRAPSPMVAIYIKYVKGPFVHYSTTETIDTCSNPCFSKTILFRPCDELTGDTIVRMVVYDVKEPVSESMVAMGYASLPLSTIQEAQRLRIALTTKDRKTVGFITINGWSLEPSYIGMSPSHTNDRNSVDIPQKIFCHRRSQSLPPRLGVKLKFPSIGSLLKQNFVNCHQVTYRLHSGLGGDITVHEIMAESKACFHIPLQLLDIYIQREKELLQELLSIGEMNSQWKTKQLELVHTHVSLLKHYWHSKRSLLSLPEGTYFKQSSKKDESSLEFAPVNLHLQRMWVHNDTLSKTGFHDIITVGAFTAHTHKAERTGGLIRLVQQVKDISNTKTAFHSAAASKLQAEYDSIIAIKKLRDQTVEVMHSIAILAQNKQTMNIEPLLEVLVGKTRSMMDLWDPSAMEESLNFIVWHKAKEAGNNGEVDGKSGALSTIERLSEQLSRFEMLNSDFENLDASSGSCSKETSPTVETPALSASVPNISNDKSQIKDNTFNDIKEGMELQFHNDYFKPEPENKARCSSLRISKNKLNGKQSSFDQNMNRGLNVSSGSLHHVAYKSLMNNLNLDNKTQQTTEIRRDSFSLANLHQRFSDDYKNTRPRTQDRKATEIEQDLAAVVDSIQKVSASEVSENEFIENLDQLKTHMDALRSSLDELLRKLRLSHATLRLRSEATQWARANAALQTRRDTCFAQALTTVTAGLLCWVCSMPSDVVLKLLTSGLGPLCGFEGLLSLYATEKAMWGDMVVAIEDLQTVVFTLTKSSNCSNVMPQVSGTRGSFTVQIPVSDSLFSKFHSKESLSFTITAVFFNVGINEKATLAEALGEATPQYQSNCDNYDRLQNYYHKYRKIFPADKTIVNRASSRTKPIEDVMENLRIVVHKKVPKNVEVLHLAALATRQMNGVRVTSCKSAKDRTGMSVTLEQCGILAAEYHLADHEMDKALHLLRSEGCRRENAYKNIGSRKYAFTKKQVAALPKSYRPPPGTYGSTQT